MQLKYHPLLAFGIFYIIGLLSLLVVMSVAGLVAPGAVTKMVGTGYVNAIPLIIFSFAAFRAATANGAPIIRYTHYNPKALRAGFKKHILLYAIAFGLFGMLCDLTTVVLSSFAQSDGSFAYPIKRLLMISGVYGVAAWFGINHSFGHPIEAALESVDTANEGVRPIPTKLQNQPWDR